MWIPRLLLAVMLVRSAASLAQALPVVSPPSYGNSVYLFLNVGDRFKNDVDFGPAADFILAGLHGGPYAPVGVSSSFPIDLPWTADLTVTNPVLTSPGPGLNPDQDLEAALLRSQARGLTVHIAAGAGLSRSPWAYELAWREDRRNAQWFGDGTFQKATIWVLPSGDTWITPSRYARKLRRHLEVKVRAFAKMLVDLRQKYPDTLVSASGDAEMELNYGGLDLLAPFENQMIADYSPFAIAEFRDWIQHTGLYAPGQPYDGEGLKTGGDLYQNAGLAHFNLDYGTIFTSWSLLYFDWDVLVDPVDDDPKAIPSSAFVAPAWTPFPPSGPLLGFDAPRSAATTDPRFWKLWTDFRQQMIRNYQTDFARWMTTTKGTDEITTFDTQRWYSHQLPADYLGGTCPGSPLCPNSPTTPPHDNRLMTSASTLVTADVAPFGSLGVTAFDVYLGSVPLGVNPYSRTSTFLFDAVRTRGVNWGLVEWSPSWSLFPAAPDPAVAAIAPNAKRAYDAGAHILNYLEWDQFDNINIPTNPPELDRFLTQVKNQPRDATTVNYAPPQVSGLSGQWNSTSTTISLSWSSLVFPGVAGFFYGAWPAFAYFETWRGASRTFGTADGVKVGTTFPSSLAAIVPDASRPFYRVRAVARTSTGAFIPGAFSDVVWLPRPASSFFQLAPCRRLDTRGTVALPGSPIAASFETPTGTLPGTLTVTLAGGCGIPMTAKAVSVNVTVTDTTAPGSLAIVPGDATVKTTTTNVSFGPGQSRANNAMLLLAGDGSGTVRVENWSPGTVHVILDVNGYFQ